MSLATSLKDFTDLLSDFSTNRSFFDHIPTHILVQQLLIFSSKALWSGIVYLLTFQWLRDFCYLPLLAPEISTASLFGENWLESPYSYLFSFSSVPKAATDELLAGFVNSFFFSLPLSVPHLLSIRRLYYQGEVAAAASVLGIIGAHSLFLIAVLFGLRFLIIPYFALESLNYLLALFITAAIINDIVQERNMRMVRLRDTNSLVKIFVSSFLLTCFEETTVFHTFKNLTLTAQSTYLDLHPLTSGFNWFISHTTYFLAFFLGNCVFSIVFYYLIVRAVDYVRFSLGSTFTYTRTARLLNKFLICCIVAFSLSSVPYYGLDYIFTRIGGFLPEDTIYSNTRFSPTVIQTKYPHFFKDTAPPGRDIKSPLSLDLNYFDRGLYLNALKDPKSTKDDPQSIPLSFEEVNYQGEYAWIQRYDSDRSLTKIRKSVLSPLFKKYRSRYSRLRSDAIQRREEAAQTAKKRVLPGKTAESREGILPNEQASVLMRNPTFLGTTLSLSRDLELKGQPLDSENVQSLSQQKKYKDAFQAPQANLVASDAHLDTHSLLNPDKEVRRMTKLDPLLEELQFEKGLNKKFSKGFAKPIDFYYEFNRSFHFPIKNTIRRKFLINPVYHALIHADIDTFLARQPTTYKLAQNQEYNLYTKRKLLQRYYNWLRYYQVFEKMIEVRYQIPDSKSFVDRIYHQQFKGTLKVARRYFNVSFDEKQNPEKKRVLSYDQLLYQDLKEQENPFLHEELGNTKVKNGFSRVNAFSKKEFENFINTEKFNSLQNSPSTLQSAEVKTPFIEESLSPPMYAAWDSEKRGFVITNRFTIKK